MFGLFWMTFASARDAQAKVEATGTVQFVYYQKFTSLAGARPFGKIFLRTSSQLSGSARKTFEREARRLEQGVSIPKTVRLPAGDYTANNIPFRVETRETVRVEIILQQTPRLSWYQRAPPWQSFALWAGAAGGIATGLYFQGEARWGREQAAKLEAYPFAAKQYETYADQSKTGSVVSMSLAGAAAVGGLAYWVLNEEVPSVAILPKTDGVGLVLGGRF